MLYLECILTGAGALLLTFLLLALLVLLFFFVRTKLHPEDNIAVGWEPRRTFAFPSWLFALAIFIAGFYWQWHRSTK